MLAPRVVIDGITYFQTNDGRIIRETFRKLPPDRQGRVWQTPVRRTIADGKIAYRVRKLLAEGRAS